MSPPTRAAHPHAWVAGLPVEVLDHLRALARDAVRPRFRDPELAARDIVDMLERGTRPALGFYRRHIDSDRLRQAEAEAKERMLGGQKQAPPDPCSPVSKGPSSEVVAREFGIGRSTLEMAS